MKPIKILVADDDTKILFAFKSVLKKDGYVCIEAKDGIEALEKVNTLKPDIVFMDVAMPKQDGLATLKQMKENNYTMPIIIMTGQGTMQTAIKAMQIGAFQYLIKPLSIDKIRDEINKAQVSIKSTSYGNMNYEMDTSNRHQLIGNSSVMHEIYKLLGSISTTANHTTVLITGETGTGKELVARAIHNNSANDQEPFVAVNCTALPETLLESELFGHMKGAFTGAINAKTGKFEQAGQGTIFLDEIGDLSNELQKKLLRVLQEREFERLGENTLRPIRARFIAATNQNLEVKIKEKTFREDLFYRLNIANLNLQPLRNHKEDIPLLSHFFLSRYSKQLNKKISGFSEAAMSFLRDYLYPGNVRELENIVERAVMLTHGNVIDTEAIGELGSDTDLKQLALPIISDDFAKSREHLLSVFEKQFVREQLRRHKGNVSAAAKTSNMSRQNFHRLILKYKLKSAISE
jgi:two-component system response regulator AtoC